VEFKVVLLKPIPKVAEFKVVLPKPIPMD